MDCSTPGFPVHHQLLQLAQTHVHRFGDAIQPSHRLSSPLLLPSIFLSIRVFSSKSVLHIRWPKYWRFSFSISSYNEYSGVISFEIAWFDLLAVQGTLKNLLQPHSSKALILWRSAFFIVQIFSWENSKITTCCWITVDRRMFSSVQSLGRVWLFVTPWTAVHQASLSITNSWSPPKPMSIVLVVPSSHLILCYPLSSCPQSFPASRSFQMSQLSTSSGQSIGVSASTSGPPMNTQDWSPLEWTGWISLESKGLSRVFSNTTVQKHQFFCAQPSL